MSAYQVPGTLAAKELKRMARDPAVFAMANLTPEILPEEAAEHVQMSSRRHGRSPRVCERANSAKSTSSQACSTKASCQRRPKRWLAWRTKPARRAASALESFGAPIAGRSRRWAFTSVLTE